MIAPRRHLLLAALSSTLGAAADANELGIETLHTSSNAAHFGEYNDLNDSGSRIIGNLDAGGELPLGGVGMRWWIDATDLGLATYDAAFGAADQGHYGARIDFVGLRQFTSDDGVTPYRGNASLALSDGWVAGPTTADMTGLAATLASFDEKKRRAIAAIDAWYLVDANWSIEAAFRHEHKTGTEVQGGAVYIDGSSGNAALLPAPIDYTTQDFTTTLRYSTARFTNALAYVYTRFDNQEAQLAWDNAYANVVDPQADYPNGRGAMSLAPDYDRQQLRLDGSLRALPGLDLQWDGAWASTRQSETLGPYTINTALAVPIPVPRSASDAELTTTTVDLRMVYQPRTATLRRLLLRGGYHYDDRNYAKPRDPYDYVRGDGAEQPPAQFGIYDTAHDQRRETIDAAVDYRPPFWRSKFSAEYQALSVERENSAVHQTDTDTYTLVWRAAPAVSVDTRLEWSYADRSGSNYDYAQAYFAEHTSDYIDQIPADQRFDNHPLLRQYQLADAELDSAKLRTSYGGIEHWYLAAEVQWHNSDYVHSALGLQQTESWFYGADVDYTPADTLSAFGHVSFSEYQTDAAGRSFGGGIEKPADVVVPPLPQGSDPARDWSNRSDDRVWTAGAGVTWQYSQRLDFSLEYTFVTTRSSNRFGSGGSQFLDPARLPDLDTTLRQCGLSARYRWRDAAAVTLRYQYYDYQIDDWAYDSVGPATLPDVLTLGQQADDERVNLVSVSLSYAL
jgi:MtrB/PioB family decaheme-associated outer membrane protein